MSAEAETSSALEARVFWATAVVVLFVALGVPSLRGSEDRFAEITREMLQSGDYFHPTLNGESHFHKPLASYWAIAAASWLVGGLGELAARLPSAAAGLVALGATVWLGRALWGVAVGRLAGWLLLSTYGFLLWSRTAAADMENAAAVILAVAWFRWGEDRPGWFFYSGFALICAVGAHAKGLATIVLPVVVLVPHLWRYERWRDHLRPGPLALAACVGAVAYLAPFLWAEGSRGAEGSLIDALVAGDPQSGLYMVFQENVRRFYAPHDHRGGVYTYVLALPVLLLPWALVFGAALVDGVRDRVRLDPETRWILSSTVLIFAVFTASGSRRSYYILPILPFCALVVAAVSSGEVRRRLVAPALRWTGIALAVAVAIEGAVVLVALPSSFGLSVAFPVRLAVTTLALVAVGYVVWARGTLVLTRIARRLDLPVGFALPLALSLVVFGGYFTLQYPLLDRFRTEKPFALELREVASGLPSSRVAFVDHVPSLFPFYMEASGPFPVLTGGDDVRTFVGGGPCVVVATSRDLARLEDVPSGLFENSPDLEETLHPWDSEEKQLRAWRIEGRASATSVLSREAGG